MSSGGSMCCIKVIPPRPSTPGKKIFGHLASLPRQLAVSHSSPSRRNIVNINRRIAEKKLKTKTSGGFERVQRGREGVRHEQQRQRRQGQGRIALGRIQLFWRRRRLPRPQGSRRRRRRQEGRRASPALCPSPRSPWPAGCPARSLAAGGELHGQGAGDHPAQPPDRTGQGGCARSRVGPA